jgi:ribosomal small subunit protein bTHX
LKKKRFLHLYFKNFIIYLTKNYLDMGKGDRKTAKGKRTKGTYGTTRLRKIKSSKALAAKKA